LLLTQKKARLLSLPLFTTPLKKFEQAFRCAILSLSLSPPLHFSNDPKWDKEKIDNARREGKRAGGGDI
jgi:hypothetical protein